MISEIPIDPLMRGLLLRSLGEPTQAPEGLLDTPARVARAYEEPASGYAMCPVAIRKRTFTKAGGYDEAILLRNIRVESYCEHHTMPTIGRADDAYLRGRKVVGISKLASGLLST